MQKSQILDTYGKSGQVRRILRDEKMVIQEQLLGTTGTWKDCATYELDSMEDLEDSIQAAKALAETWGQRTGAARATGWQMRFTHEDGSVEWKPWDYVNQRFFEDAA